VQPSPLRTTLVLAGVAGAILWAAWPGTDAADAAATVATKSAGLPRAEVATIDADATRDQVRALIESGRPPAGQEDRYPLVPRNAAREEPGFAAIAIGLAQAQSEAPAIGAPAPKASGKDETEIDWLELMPPEDIKKLQELPAVDHTGMISADQFMSFNTVEELDGRKGRIAGYVVPIETNEAGELTSFFLVPYFGACIHVPPPPPNQIVYAKLAKAIPVPDMYAPQWVQGTLVIERTDNEIGASAYTMKVDTVTLWDG
jgi:hypothetical protein